MPAFILRLTVLITRTLLVVLPFNLINMAVNMSELYAPNTGDVVAVGQVGERSRCLDKATVHPKLIPIEKERFVVATYGIDPKSVRKRVLYAVAQISAVELGLSVPTAV